jgi:hypothetical protein
MEIRNTLASQLASINPGTTVSKLATYCNKPENMFTVAITKLQNAISVGFQRGLL